MRPAILALVLSLVACGASARDKTLHATFISVTAARDGFLAWDAQHQLNLVKASSSKVMAEVALSDYYAHRAKVVAALEAAYRAIAAAAIAEADPTLSGIIAAASELSHAIETLYQLSGDGDVPVHPHPTSYVPPLAGKTTGGAP